MHQAIGTKEDRAMASSEIRYVELSAQNEEEHGALNLGTINDLLLACPNPDHTTRGVTF